MSEGPTRRGSVRRRIRLVSGTLLALLLLALGGLLVVTATEPLEHERALESGATTEATGVLVGHPPEDDVDVGWTWRLEDTEVESFEVRPGDEAMLLALQGSRVVVLLHEDEVVGVRAAGGVVRTDDIGPRAVRDQVMIGLVVVLVAGMPLGWGLRAGGRPWMPVAGRVLSVASPMLAFVAMLVVFVAARIR